MRQTKKSQCVKPITFKWKIIPEAVAHTKTHRERERSAVDSIGTMRFHTQKEGRERKSEKDRIKRENKRKRE